MLPTRSTRRWIEHHVAEYDPDVVFYAAPHPLAFLGPDVRAATGTPYAVMTHGAELTIPAGIPGLRSLVARPLRAADVVFAVSDFTASRVARLTGRPAITLGAGVDVDRFTPGPPDGGDGLTVIGCVSRFVPRKGQTRVLRAAAMLASEGVIVRVVLVGKGRTERRLRQEARRRGVDTEFHVNVPWDVLPGLYRSFDLFAMPCYDRWFGLEVEGLGIVFLEAAASGVAVVAGNSGGAPETVVDGETGHVVDTDVELLTALRALVADPDRRAAMGSAGRRFVESEWTWERVAERLVSGLESALSGG